MGRRYSISMLIVLLWALGVVGLGIKNHNLGWYSMVAIAIPAIVGRFVFTR